MDTHAYHDFLKEIRDTVSAWVGEQDICDLFASDMRELQDLYHEDIEEVQRIQREQDCFHRSPEGRAWLRECEQRLLQGTDEKPEPPEPLRECLPDSHLDKFRRHSTNPLSVNDYRILLGVVHDGVTWHERDKRQYICRELLEGQEVTFARLLFFGLENGRYSDGIYDEPRFERLIREALAVVEKDIGDAAKEKGPVNTGEYEIPWDESNPAYIQAGAARVKYTRSELPASTLSEKLGRIPVRFMRKGGRGSRVHEKDFASWAKGEYPEVTDDRRAKIADEVHAAREAMKHSLRRK